jgi:hypothetical protein
VSLLPRDGFARQIPLQWRGRTGFEPVSVSYALKSVVIAPNARRA